MTCYVILTSFFFFLDSTLITKKLERKTGRDGRSRRKRKEKGRKKEVEQQPQQYLRKAFHLCYCVSLVFSPCAMPSFTKLLSSITGSSSQGGANGGGGGLNNRTSSSTQSPLLPSSSYDPKTGRSGVFSTFSSGNNNSNDQYHTSVCNKVNPKQPILITVAIESPPITLYGNPADSSGAFFSGTLILDIFLDGNTKDKQIKPVTSTGAPDPSASLEPMMSVSKLSQAQLAQDYIILKKVSLYLIQTVKYGKPFVPDSNTLQSCPNCTKKITELAHWDILSKKTAFAKGSSHSCPFSYVIPGSIPPTTILSNFNTSIKYELICLATYVDPKTGKDQLINLAQPIKIHRSILREQDRNSTRIFPPTDVTSTAVIPNVVYPRSSFPVEIRMDHVSTPKRRWRMRKLNWRLEECVCVKTNHCQQHDEKYRSVYNTMKKQKKSVRINKNSGGMGNASINYYFETPKHQLNNNNSSIASSNRNNDRDTNSSPLTDDLFPSTSNSNLGSQPLAPSASNWSVPASPMTSNTGAPNSLDQILSSSISQQQQQQETQLSNPDEVVMPAPSTSDGPKKQTDEIFIEEIRTISSGVLKSGWKSDFSGCGRIELVVEVSLMNLISMGINNTIAYKGSINSQTCNLTFNELYEDANSDCNCSTDVDDPELGISVTHNLILEIVVAEELMQSTLASSNQSAKARQHQQQSHGHRSPGNTGSSISSNSTAAIVTGNMNSQSRMRPVSSSTSSSNTQTGTRTTLSEEDFPDDRVGPEYATGNKADVSNHMQGIPTGVARVLRMQFKVILSERSGLGVAWDDEVPPTYHAVGALSPPTYDQAASSSTPPSNYGLAVPLESDDNVNEMANLKL